MLERMMLAIALTLSACLSVNYKLYQPVVSGVVQRPANPNANISQVR